MSDRSTPKPNSTGNRKENNHNEFNESHLTTSKRKFEGWPILWILLVILIAFLCIWLSGNLPAVINWIKNK